MKVAFDVGPVRPEPTGVGVFATAMANALAAELGPEGLRLIGMRADASGLTTAVPTTRRSPRSPYLVWVELAAARDARRVGADLVHYADGVAPVVRHGKTILAIHDMSIVREWRSHPVRRYARIGLVLAAPLLSDMIVVPSRATADEVMRLTGCPARKLEIVPYAPQSDVRRGTDASVAEVMSRYRLERGRYVLSLGTIEPRKNHLRLVSAFERMINSRAVPDDVRLVIAGKPGWRHGPVVRALRESSAGDRIVRLGYVPGEDLPCLIAGAGVVAYVSLYEGFGLPVVEAMACGAPTVTSAISSMPEVAGDAGFLVDPYDPEDIARGLERAFTAGQIDHAGVAQRSIRQASLFSWQATARLTAEIYRSVVD